MTDTPATNAPAPLAKAYRPTETEPAVWSKWLDANAFHADPARVVSGEAPPYSILIPPPNVTAALHLGHALNNTIQDILIRAHRMKGFETLWMPGTDHAGIATQTMVDKRLKDAGEPALAEHRKLEAEGKNGREQFVEKVQAFKDEFETRITDQLKAMGCSCDYERQRFTMDEVCARAVREAFFRLFKDGLIERGKRLVNWDPVTQTALADDEVEMEEVDGAFYKLRYPLIHPSDSADHSPVTWGELAARGYPGADQHPDDEQAWITIATTRPETYLGDVAVAVNPKDPRADSLKGLLCELPLVGRRVPIIADDYVVLPVAFGGPAGDAKAEMSTGFLKVTPAHDLNDEQLGKRHEGTILHECRLADGSRPTTIYINIMAPDASISDQHGWSDVGNAQVFLGKSREDARKLVVKEFKARTVAEGQEGSLLEAVTPYRHSVGHSYRSHAAIEPYLSDQWYCRVTDDRLRGNAQRALPLSQRTDASLQAWPESTPNTGGTGVPPVSSATITKRHRNLPHWEREGSAYFLTFRVAEGTLSDSECQIILDACFHFHGDRHHTYIATVMPDHVHVVLKPLPDASGKDRPLSEIMHSIKSYSAHAINKQRGSTGPVWQDESFDRIIRDQEEFEEKTRYIFENPVRAGLVGDPSQYPFSARDFQWEEHRRDACATATGKSTDGRMTFHPARYAKTYETWHDNLRDWCISRQLWWGHRIPVWSKIYDSWEQLEDEIEGKLHKALRAFRHDIRGADDPSEGEEFTAVICLAELNSAAEQLLESHGFEQDPDVLDTWFSSALWPLSTMGWPDASAAASGTGIEDFTELLSAFNPTSTLTTAREIITLWVSRMAMFNRYFLGQDSGTGVPPVQSKDHRRDACATGSMPGPAPFKDVFIHAMIQDGEGRKMSKSLGNGVDPLDIIASHGADAMRFTLCQMTTQTQDVRMPVEHDPSTGKNTSPKFDIGRNLCNKLWNASRFALGMLEKTPVKPGMPIDPQELSLVDRWMLSRVVAATASINAAIKNYQFKDYADALYDLLWRDFCDWYLESIKPTLATDPHQPAVLRLVLDAILRLMHPVTPFITEALHERVGALPSKEITGFAFSPTKSTQTLCQSGWPEPDAGLRDDVAEDAYGRMRSLVTAIREVRASMQVPPKRQIVLHADAALAEACKRWSPLVETLAGVKEITTDAAPAVSAALPFEGTEHRLSDLTDQADAGAEKDRLMKELEGVEKSIKALEGRLSNPGYTDKAPAHLVQQTRDELTAKQQEADTLRNSIGALG